MVNVIINKTLNLGKMHLSVIHYLYVYGKIYNIIGHLSYRIQGHSNYGQI